MENKQLNNEDTYRNLITLYRMKFTESLILCNICEINDYSDFELINNIVKNLYDIFIKMSIDLSFMQGADRSARISRFLSKIIGKIDEYLNELNQQIAMKMPSRSILRKSPSIRLSPNFGKCFFR